MDNLIVVIPGWAVIALAIIMAGTVPLHLWISWLQLKRTRLERDIAEFEASNEQG